MICSAGWAAVMDGAIHEYGKINRAGENALGEAQNLALTNDHQHLKQNIFCSLSRP